MLFLQQEQQTQLKEGPILYSKLAKVTECKHLKINGAQFFNRKGADQMFKGGLPSFLG